MKNNISSQVLLSTPPIPATSCSYDEATAKGVSGKSYGDCVNEINEYEKNKTINNNIRTRQRFEKKITLFLALALVVIEILDRAWNQNQPTKSLAPLVDLGRQYNIKPVMELDNLFSSQNGQIKAIEPNYYELLGIAQDETSLARSIAKQAKFMHTDLAKLLTDLNNLPPLPNDGKIIKNDHPQAKKVASSEVLKDDIKSITDRLKYLKSKLPPVTIQAINTAPKSQLNDLENISYTDKTLALNFERAARHLELVAHHVSVEDRVKFYNEFIEIRMDSGITISEDLQKLLKFYRRT